MKQLYRHDEGPSNVESEIRELPDTRRSSIERRVDERAERIGRNEDLFRKVNDEIEGMNEAFGTITGTMSILCECGKLDCIEQIDVTLDEYRELRAEPTHFAVKPGHEITDVEEIVARRDGYFVVAKAEGDPARLAKDLAEPRS
jgi:hypothetical protein